MIADTLAGQRVTIMGLGRFGGGSGATRFCAQRGAKVLLTDLLNADDLADSLHAIRDLLDSGQVQLRLGGHEESDFRTADLVIASPAVPRPWANPFLQAAAQAGVTITTEIGLLSELLPDMRRVIAVTGTAGKSTTAAMIGRALRTAATGLKIVHVGGNIGGSLLEHDLRHDDHIVLELSSAQLYWLKRAAETQLHPPFAPRVAAITTFAPNHLDWHDTIEHYRDCKASLFAAPGADDFAILAEVGPEWRSLTGAARIVTPDFESHLPRVAQSMRLPGRHNARNAVTAGIAASCALGEESRISAADLMIAAATFPGLSHRLQLICERPGIRIYNDSKSTTPESTALAVEAFEEPRQLHLIIGGYDKGIDLTPLIEAARRCAAAYPIGAVGESLAQALGIENSETLDRAVERAMAAMRRGDVLLLSPGCASWDQYRNFEDRGERFTQLVRSALDERR